MTGPLEAAQALVTAFGAHDRAAYFAAFAVDATFVFHTHPELLRDRAAYEELWTSWEAEGFHVESCTSTDQRVDVLTPDVAVFTHRVRTRLAGEPHELRERETIVLRRTSGTWLAVHEHLSSDPSEDGTP